MRKFYYLVKYYLRKDKKDSIFFYTFHKCASTLFASYVLKNVDGLDNIDYARYLWNKPNSFKRRPFYFKSKGYIYGPIRLSGRNKLMYNLLVIPTSNLDFVKNKTAMFFIRDPRDILVSSYYSFGYTHALNSNKERRSEQLKKRKLIQSLTVDEYVIRNAERQIENFNALKTIADNCKNKVILKYEDMIENFDLFSKNLKTIVSISDDVVQNIYERSRPKKSIDNQSHRRSGALKRYTKDLKPETITILNKKLKGILDEFKYSE